MGQETFNSVWPKYTLTRVNSVNRVIVTLLLQTKFNFTSCRGPTAITADQVQLHILVGGGVQLQSLQTKFNFTSCRGPTAITADQVQLHIWGGGGSDCSHCRPSSTSHPGGRGPLHIHTYTCSRTLRSLCSRTFRVKYGFATSFCLKIRR